MGPATSQKTTRYALKGYDNPANTASIIAGPAATGKPGRSPLSLKANSLGRVTATFNRRFYVFLKRQPRDDPATFFFSFYIS